MHENAIFSAAGSDKIPPKRESIPPILAEFCTVARMGTPSKAAILDKNSERPSTASPPTIALVKLGWRSTTIKTLSEHVGIKRLTWRIIPQFDEGANSK